MPVTFRYRYVDIGTIFTGDLRRRSPEAVADSPSTLFANEIACDVGGTCWGDNEPLPILDHHYLQSAQFPSACAAVLHKAALIHSRFAGLDEVIWLVTHQDPDFDAFCSMYLARRIIENDIPHADWERYGLNSDGWVDPVIARKIDWLSPELGSIPCERRWPLLLATYASLLEMRRHIPCALQWQLRSVLYAALKRGRDYLSAASGASEFFDEVRLVLREKQLNPTFDSVLDSSANFAPELAMLDQEVERYQNDLRRSRKALVYLPEAEAPTPDFFEHASKAISPQTTESSSESLLLADSFRIATDGIYLRDPECTLFREWARVDLENSALGSGFEFTAIAFSDRLQEVATNATEYIFSIDPERANGRHLYTVWSRLQTEELSAVHAQLQEAADKPACDARTTGIGSVLSDPWLGGDRQSSTLVAAPRYGSQIGPPGSRSDLGDDPVVGAVRTELEGPIYAAASLVSGPQITVHDFAASKAIPDKPRQFQFNAPLKLQPPDEGYFRYASIGLRADVPIATGNAAARVLVRQIGESLWQFLYPEKRGEVPTDFDSHLVATTDWIGVWSERGVAIASEATPESLGRTAAVGLLQDFAAIVSWIRDIEQLTSEWDSVGTVERNPIKTAGRTRPNGSVQRSAECEKLARRALELQHTLTLPDRGLLRHFSESIGFEQLVGRLDDLIRAAANQQSAVEEGRRTGEKTGDVARVRQQVRWLEVLVIAFIVLELVAILLRSGMLGNASQQVFTWLGGPLGFVGAAWILQPWRTKQGGQDVTLGFKWLVAVASVVWAVAWLMEILR
jgi:hypothetical protein